MQHEELKLHDIKPLVMIEDYSFYIFVALSIIGAIVIAGLLFLVLKWLKEQKKENLRKKHLELLHAIDLQDTKKAAYALTKYGATFKDDDERHRQMYENMLQKLQKYKYKKEVDGFDEETLAIINLYREMCDV